eukprot:87717_1
MRARRQLLMARNKTHLLFGSMLRATGWLHVSLQQLVVEQEICLLIAVLSRQLLMARNKTHTTINGTAVTGDMSVDCRDDYACAEATINGAEQNTFVICMRARRQLLIARYKTHLLFATGRKHVTRQQLMVQR